MTEGSHSGKGKQYGQLFLQCHRLDSYAGERSHIWRRFDLPVWQKWYMCVERSDVGEGASVFFVFGEPYFSDFIVVVERSEVCEVTDAVVVGDKADLDVLSCVGSR